MDSLQSRPSERVIHRLPPEPILEWILLFPDGRPASVPLRTSDAAKARAWAAAHPTGSTLHRRIVLEGHWFPHDLVVDVQPDPEARST